MLTRLCASIANAIQFCCEAKQLSLLMVFALLYAPFLFTYGWGYRHIPNFDLPSFYAASVEVFRHGGSPYEREQLQSLMGGNAYVFPYLYPPPSLLFFYPLSLVDYNTARLIVLAVNHAIIVALLGVIPWFLLRDSSRKVIGAFALTCVYLLTFRPTAITLNHGQVNLLLLAFLLAFWLLAKAGKVAFASLFLALAVFLKTYPVIIMPILLVTGRRRECLYTCAWLGLGAFISLMMIRGVIWQDWFTKVLPSAGYACTPVGLFPPAAIWNQSLNGLFARGFTLSPWSRPTYVDVGLARHLTYAAAGLVAVISALAARRSAKVHAGDLDRTMLLALPAMYLVAPYSWEHHLVYLLPVILMLLMARVTLPPLATGLFHFMSIGSAVLFGMDGCLGLKVYGVLVLWILGIVAACSRDIELPKIRIMSVTQAPPEAQSATAKP